MPEYQFRDGDHEREALQALMVAMGGAAQEWADGPSAGLHLRFSERNDDPATVRQLAALAFHNGRGALAFADVARVLSVEALTALASFTIAARTSSEAIDAWMAWSGGGR